jgi:hypothetical protein
MSITSAVFARQVRGKTTTALQLKDAKDRIFD